MVPSRCDRGVYEHRFRRRGVDRRVGDDLVTARVSRADALRVRLAAPVATWRPLRRRFGERLRQVSRQGQEVGGHDGGADVAGKALLPAPGAAFETEAALEERDPGLVPARKFRSRL